MNPVSVIETQATATTDQINTELAMSWKMPRVIAAFRLVTTCMLVALFWKWAFFLAADHVYVILPLADSFFPAWLQSIWTLRMAFVVTTSALSFAFVTDKSSLRHVACWYALIGVTILVWHQGAHNDMTFATAWWTCLWAVWFTGRIGKIADLESEQGRAAGEELMHRAAFLSRLIVSLILLGGAVGKWTSEYWSGQVFYEIYFIDRDFWVFNWLRATCDQEALREIATWYSRKAVVIETLGGFGIWLLPPRHAAAAGVLIFASIALLSNFLLFSVLLTMIGLSAVGWFAVGKPPVRSAAVKP